MYHSQARCVGGHEPGNEANHMIDFKKALQHICSCACVCVCVGGGSSTSLIVLQATPFAERGRLQPSSCCHNRNLMWPIRSALFAYRIRCHGVQYVTCLVDVSILFLTAMVDNCIPRRQLSSCSMTRPFLCTIWSYVEVSYILLREAYIANTRNDMCNLG